MFHPLIYPLYEFLHLILIDKRYTFLRIIHRQRFISQKRDLGLEIEKFLDSIPRKDPPLSEPQTKPRIVLCQTSPLCR